MVKVPDFTDENSSALAIIHAFAKLLVCVAMSLVLLITGIFLAVTVLTGLFRRIALRARLLDLPVSRSAHTHPTPVAGGLGIVLVYFVLATWLRLSAIMPMHEYMAVLGGLVIAGVGLVDDYRHLDIKWRMPAQFLAAIWSAWWLGDVPAIQFGSLTLPASWLLNLLAVVALVWLTNLYNFMDGIDGIAGGELVFVSALSLFFVITAGDQVLSLLTATLLGAGAGFLVWNWSPARIFLGDAGSGFIGFSLGVLALISMQHGSMSVWTWVLLLGVFIVDATVTLCLRYLRGDKWYEGHASHAYQNAARKHKSHAKVTISVLVINSLWLAPLAWCSVQFPDLGLYLALLGLVPLVILAIRNDAGKTPGVEHMTPSIQSIS